MQFNQNVTPTTLLDCLILVELHKRRSYFLSVKANLVQIFFLWVVWIPHHERSVLAFFHMILQCAFICCATCTVMLLDFGWTAQMETRLPICMCTVISHWGKIRIFHNCWPVFCHFHQKIKFSTILVLPNWHAKSYIEGEACLLLNQVMKGKNKRKKNKNQLPVL